MKGSLKKVTAFVVIAAVLAGGAWYFGREKREDVSLASFEKALNIMKNLQSLAVPDALSENDLASLETAYNELRDNGTNTQGRITIIRAFRDADVTELTALLDTLNVTGTLKTSILSLAQGHPSNYLSTTSGIAVKIAALAEDVSTANRAKIRSLADSVNSYANDARVGQQYIDWYASKRPNICQTTDPENSPYVKGVITFRYDSTRTAVIESCDTNASTSSGGVLKQHLCSGLEYVQDSRHDVDYECQLGCNLGRCMTSNFASNSEIQVVNGNTEDALPVSEIKANQTFYLKIKASRLHTAKAFSDITGKEARASYPTGSTGMGYTLGATAATKPAITVTGGTCTTRPTALVTEIFGGGFIKTIRLTGAVNCSEPPIISIAPPAITDANTTLTAVLSSPSFTAPVSTGSTVMKCHSATSSALSTSLPITSGDLDKSYFFGPIACETVEDHAFTIDLKESVNYPQGSSAQTLVNATKTKTIPVGSVSMGNFVIEAPDTVAAGTPFDITVRAKGTNGLDYNYTEDFYLIINGDDEAVFPQGPQTMPTGQSSKTITGIKLSNNGTFNNLYDSKVTIKARGTNVSAAEKVITVVSVDLQVKKGEQSSSNTFSKDITIDAGDKVTHKWQCKNCTGAGWTYFGSYTNTKEGGGTCGANLASFTSFLNTNGGINGALHTTDAWGNVYKGCTYTYVYTAKNTTLNPDLIITDSAKVHINF